MLPFFPVLLFGFNVIYIHVLFLSTKNSFPFLAHWTHTSCLRDAKPLFLLKFFVPSQLLATTYREMPSVTEPEAHFKIPCLSAHTKPFELPRPAMRKRKKGSHSFTP